MTACGRERPAADGRFRSEAATVNVACGRRKTDPRRAGGDQGLGLDRDARSIVRPIDVIGCRDAPLVDLHVTFLNWSGGKDTEPNAPRIVGAEKKC